MDRQPDRLRAVHVVSSMAPGRLLTALAERAGTSLAGEVRAESMGGVDLARNLRDGGRADVVVLAEPPTWALAVNGILDSSTVRPLFGSELVAAVPADAPLVDLTSEQTVQATLRSAGRIGLSTGRSGDAIRQLLVRWDLMGELGDRLRVAPAGVPVASLLADGVVDLGFQQRPELSGAPGVRVVGPLPERLGFTTIFAGAVHARAHDRAAAVRVLEWFAAAENVDLITEGAMTPASDGTVRHQ